MNLTLENEIGRLNYGGRYRRICFSADGADARTSVRRHYWMIYDYESGELEPELLEPRRNFASRVVNAALLNHRTFRDVRDDRNASLPVFGLILAAGIASAVGVIQNPGFAIVSASATITSIFSTVLVARLMRKFVFVSINVEASRSELMRVIGIASGPALLRAFAIFPVIGWLIWIAGAIWMFVAIVVGMKAALGFKNFWPPIGILVLSLFFNGVLWVFVFGIL